MNPEFSKFVRSVTKTYADDIADEVLKNLRILNVLAPPPPPAPKPTARQLAKEKKRAKLVRKARSELRKLLSKFPELWNELPGQDD